VQLRSFGIFHERIDPSGRLVAGRSRFVPSGQPPPAPSPLAARALSGLLVTAIAAVLALIAVVAYPRLSPPERGDVAVRTVPPGAIVEVDGAAKGTTGDEPLVLASLEVGQKYKVEARREGYRPALEVVTPRSGTTELELVLAPLAATLVVATTPAGAALFLGGEEVGATPVSLADLEPGSTQIVRVVKPGYRELEQAVTVPGPGGKTEVQLFLVRAADLSSILLESDPPGAAVLQNGEPLAGLRTPVEHTLEVGRTYQFTLRLAGHAPETVTVKARPGTTPPVSTRLRPGGLYTLQTNLPEGKITVGDAAGCQGRSGPVVECALENGRHRVRVASVRPYVVEVFTVTMNSQDVVQKLELGFVETAAADVTIKLPGAPADTRRAGFVPGDRNVTLVHAKSGLTVVKPVKIVAGRTVKVDPKQL
jgi:hypothetical protein